jgi:hypothetical protein
MNDYILIFFNDLCGQEEKCHHYFVWLKFGVFYLKDHVKSLQKQILIYVVEMESQ